MAHIRGPQCAGCTYRACDRCGRAHLTCFMSWAPPCDPDDFGRWVCEDCELADRYQVQTATRSRPTTAGPTETGHNE